MSPYLLKRILRRPGVAISAFVLAGVLCFAMTFQASYRSEQQDRLRQVQRDFDIPCVITDRKGAVSSGLRMPSYVYNLVTDPEGSLAKYIRDVEVTKEFYYEYVTGPGNQEILYGVNSPACAPVLDPTLGGKTQTPADFWDSADYVCLASQEVYEALLEAGEEEALTLEIKAIDPKYYDPQLRSGEGEIELQVVGWYAGTGKELYMPFEGALKLMKEIGVQVSCDRVRFYTVDNLKLQELSETAAQWFPAPDPAATDGGAMQYALTIHDENYRSTVSALRQNIRRAEFLLPVLLALSLLLGFLVSFLATRGESPEYALMRSVGLGCGRLLGSALVQQLLLPLVACLLVSLATGQYQAGGIYFACYSAGSIAAVLRAIRVQPMELLKEQE